MNHGSQWVHEFVSPEKGFILGHGGGGGTGLHGETHGDDAQHASSKHEDVGHVIGHVDGGQRNAAHDGGLVVEMVQQVRHHVTDRLS